MNVFLLVYRSPYERGEGYEPEILSVWSTQEFAEGAARANADRIIKGMRTTDYEIREMVLDGELGR